MDLRRLLLNIENENTRITNLYQTEKTQNQNAAEAMKYVIQINSSPESP